MLAHYSSNSNTDILECKWRESQKAFSFDSWRSSPDHAKQFNATEVRPLIKKSCSSYWWCRREDILIPLKLLWLSPLVGLAIFKCHLHRVRKLSIYSIQLKPFCETIKHVWFLLMWDVCLWKWFYLKGLNVVGLYRIVGFTRAHVKTEPQWNNEFLLSWGWLWQNLKCLVQRVSQLWKQLARCADREEKRNPLRQYTL